jgi:hypothetical protein
MRIGGATWNIDSRDFIVEVNDGCIGAIVGADNGIVICLICDT